MRLTIATLTIVFPLLVMVSVFTARALGTLTIV